jgi:hypothetical protein
MADSEPNTIPIPLRLPHDEADAFAKMLKRFSYGDAERFSSRTYRYPDNRTEADVMWSAVRTVERQFGEAGFAPR